MKVRELIHKLSQYDGELEVILTDGYQYNFYNSLNLAFELFVDDNGKTKLDIGLGGCIEQDEEGN